MSHDNGHDHDQERAIDLKLLLDDSSTPGHDLVSEAGMIDLKMLLDDSSTPDQTMTNAKKRKTTDQTMTNAKTMTSAKTTDHIRASANTTDRPMTQAMRPWAAFFFGTCRTEVSQISNKAHLSTKNL